MPKYTIVSPVLQNGVVLSSGEVELTSEDAKRLIELKVVEEIEKENKKTGKQKQEGDK